MIVQGIAVLLDYISNRNTRKFVGWVEERNPTPSEGKLISKQFNS